MATDFRGAPGVYTGNSITSRQVLRDPSKAEYDPTLATITGSLSRDTGSSPTSLLRAGTLLGKITTGGNYRPSIIGLTDGAITSGTKTSVTVDAVVATEVARLITVAGGNVSLKLVGPPSAAGTVAVTAITCTAASGTTLTVSSVSIPNLVDNSLVVPADGSEYPRTVLIDPFGVDVLASDGTTNVNQPLSGVLRKAALITSSIPYYTGLDASTITWIKTQLNVTSNGSFQFDDDR